MIGSLMMATALMGQVSPARRDWTPDPAAARVAAAAKAKALAAGATPAAAKVKADAAVVDYNNGARRRRLDAAWRRRLEAERREEIAAAKAQAEYEKRYREMLPYMMEQQRQYLDRLSAMERNAALDRMARAAESQASAANAAAWALYRNR